MWAKLWPLGLALLLVSTIPSIQGQNAGFDTTVDRYNAVPVFQSNDSLFTMTYNKWYKVITNKVLNQSYIVTYGGQPLASDFPLNGSIFVNGNSNNQTTIGVSGSPSAYSYLENLGLQDRVHYSESPALVTSPCYNGLTTTTTPTVLISNTTTVTGSSNTTTIIGFSPSDTMSPMEQASWIMYLSYFYDLESKAFQLYNNIQGQYQCRQSNLATSGAKTIAVTLYERNQWALVTSRYFTSLISDAGMTVFNGSMQTLHEADVVLDVSPTDSFANNYNTWLLLVDSYDHATQVFTSKKNVYRIDGLTNRDGALDWTERAPSRPDLMIQDIIHMVYPTYDANYRWTWLRNFAKGDSPRSSLLAYPSCTEQAKMFAGGCQFGSYSPGDSTTGQNTPYSPSAGGLSTSAKIGTIVGVILVVLGIGGGIGFFCYRKKQQQTNPERTFYKMNDI